MNKEVDTDRKKETYKSRGNGRYIDTRQLEEGRGETQKRASKESSRNYTDPGADK
jgi:hypothetical protein